MRVKINNKFINGVNCLDKLSKLRRKYLKAERNDFNFDAQNYFKNFTIITFYGNEILWLLESLVLISKKKIINTTIKMQNMRIYIYWLIIAWIRESKNL